MKVLEINVIIYLK